MKNYKRTVLNLLPLCSEIQQIKKEFIDSQTDIPDLSQFNLSDKEKSDIKRSCQNLFNKLSEYLVQKNELALLKQQIDSITTEYKHFQEENNTENDIDFF